MRGFDTFVHAGAANSTMQSQFGTEPPKPDDIINQEGYTGETRVTLTKAVILSYQLSVYFSLKLFIKFIFTRRRNRKRCCQRLPRCTS